MTGTPWATGRHQSSSKRIGSRTCFTEIRTYFFPNIIAMWHILRSLQFNMICHQTFTWRRKEYQMKVFCKLWYWWITLVLSVFHIYKAANKFMIYLAGPAMQCILGIIRLHPYWKRIRYSYTQFYVSSKLHFRSLLKNSTKSVHLITKHI